jgi:hypothetical protein
MLMLMMQTGYAQMCPGGGVDFNSAITFDPAWIYGCNTGTSCNGGVVFDNRLACEVTTAMDACAPAPSCGSYANNASDVWFKFYADVDTATISCFQNTSLIIGVQAFTGGPACGSLTEIGCALSGGPSSGVTLKLRGLTPGKRYYFRVFGSSHVSSQRTGLYCFCGTLGLNFTILSTALTGFKGSVRDNKVDLNWTYPGANNDLVFEVEHSIDGKAFNSISRVNGSQAFTGMYTYSDQPATDGINYYRIKVVKADGSYEYSAMLPVKFVNAKSTVLISNTGGRYVQVKIEKPTSFLLYDPSGTLVRSFRLPPGRHMISTAQLAAGVYFLRNSENNATGKLVVGGY